jgi:hypothetical protein
VAPVMSHFKTLKSPLSKVNHAAAEWQCFLIPEVLVSNLDRKHAMLNEIVRGFAQSLQICRYITLNVATNASLNNLNNLLFISLIILSFGAS